MKKSEPKKLEQKPTREKRRISTTILHHDIYGAPHRTKSDAIEASIAKNFVEQVSEIINKDEQFVVKGPVEGQVIEMILRNKSKILKAITSSDELAQELK